MRKIIFVITAAMLLSLLCGCSNIDPKVTADPDGEISEYEDDSLPVGQTGEEPGQDPSEAEETDTAQGPGEPADTEDETAPLPAAVSLEAMANRAYELCFMLAQPSFTSPSQMSVNALVQYAFCHLFYENLKDMPTGGIQYREATEEQIQAQLKKQFNLTGLNIKEANLYNAGAGKFEMWQPAYGTQIYYDVSGRNIGDGKCEITAVFYTDGSRSLVKGTVTLTVAVYSEAVYIEKMTVA